MAPVTKADPEAVVKLLDIQRTIWMQRTDIPLVPGAYRKTNGFKNKNPKVNADITLTEFEVDGEKTTKVYIADPWGGTTVTVSGTKPRARSRRKKARIIGKAARAARKVNR